MGERIAVVGGGRMGHGIAQVFAAAGHAVVVVEPAAAVRAGIRQRIARNLERLGADPAPARAVEVSDELEPAVRAAGWVFEAAPEDLALKRELFARIAAAAPRDAVLASNSSALPVGEVGADAEGPERLVGTHWWNPPYLVPLVEVVEGAATEAGVVERTIELLERVGKTAVHVRRDVPGFVGNRLQHALWREAFDLVDAGVCDAETIDTVVKAGFGRRLGVLGPMENADLVGLDLTLAIHEYLLPHLAPPSDPAAGLRERVAAGRTGAAVGEGWRSWSPESRAETEARLDEGLRAASEGGSD